MHVRLLDIAHARSGDKGDTANVGVIALKPEWYPFLVEQLTRERVAEQYAAPFDAVFDGADAVAALGDVDRTRAAALLLGPIVLCKLSTLPDVDYHDIADAAVDGFLATHLLRRETTSASSESEGA